MTTAYQPRFKTKYRTEVAPALHKEFSYGNVMQIPRLTKIVLNTTTKDVVQNSKLLDVLVDELTTIAGQKAVMTRARRSVANFKLREGVGLGARVTLRGDRMWEFFDRLVAVAIPRIRDFRGLPAWSWDGRGNYTFGLSEQTMFPEIEYDKVDSPQGMDITIVTTATTDEEGKALLEAFGFPFKRGKDAGAKPKKVVRRRGPGAPGSKGKK